MIFFSNFHRHLARNPFICDCNLRWLADYLQQNPIETSGARCESPKRMYRRRFELINDEKFKCRLFMAFYISIIHVLYSHLFHVYTGVDDPKVKYAGECRNDIECPAACHCDRTTVDCSARGLKDIPRDIPLYTTEL